MEKTTKAMRCISLQFRDISRYCIVKICKALPRPWSWLSGLNCCQGTKCTVSAARAYIEQSTIDGTHSAHHSTIFINFIASSCQHLVETCDSDPRMGKRWCVWRTPCHLVGLWLTVTKTMKWIWYALVLSCVVHHFIPPVWKGDCGCSSSRMFWHSENPFFCVSRRLLHASALCHTYIFCLWASLMLLPTCHRHFPQSIKTTGRLSALEAIAACLSRPSIPTAIANFATDCAYTSVHAHQCIRFAIKHFIFKARRATSAAPSWHSCAKWSALFRTTKLAEIAVFDSLKDFCRPLALVSIIFCGSPSRLNRKHRSPEMLPLAFSPLDDWYIFCNSFQ